MVITLVTDIVRVPFRGEASLSSGGRFWLVVPVSGVAGKRNVAIWFVCRDREILRRSKKRRTVAKQRPLSIQTLDLSCCGFVCQIWLPKLGCTNLIGEEYGLDGYHEIELKDPEQYVHECGHLVITFTITVEESNLDAFLDSHKKVARGPNVHAPPSCDLCGKRDSLYSEKLFSISSLPFGYLRIFHGEPFHKDAMTDFVIVSKDDRAFHVHKCILCSESKFFMDMLTGPTTDKTVEGQTNSMTADFDADVVKAFLEVLYDRKKIDGYADNCASILPLYKMAHMYQVPDIVGLCERAIGRISVPRDQLIDALRVVAIYDQQQLLVRCALLVSILPKTFWDEEPINQFNSEYPRVVTALFRETLAFIEKKLNT